MYAPAKKLSRVNANLQQAIAAPPSASSRCSTRTPRCRSARTPWRCRRSRARIEFRDVTFGYDDGHGRDAARRVVHGGAGQMVAIVGRSGAGKTTLVNLLPRFYDVTGGAILIDGLDIRDVTLASLRAQIGIVTQETVLFDDTIAANIAYGVPTPTREQIEAAARAATPTTSSAGCRHGYDTMIGERGQRLSGGQRQRLAIARAILRELADSDPRRGDLVARRRIGAAGAGRAGEPDAEPHVVRHRAPAVHGAPRRRDRRARARPDRRDRHARRADGAAGGAYAKLYELQLLEDEPSREIDAS